MGKLVRIEHIECSEWSGYSYLIAPDNITEEKLQEDANKALEQYLETKRNFEDLNPKPLYPSNRLEDYPDAITINEARRREFKEKEEWTKWQDARLKVGRSFGAYMVDLGYQFLYEVDMLEATVNWGHNHREIIDMDLTETDCTQIKNLE
jgi:4-aminobutyrate aminotransferase-like enzyme